MSHIHSTIVTSKLSPRLALALALIGFVPAPLRAAIVSKANNATDLDLTASWTGGSVPGTADIAQWDSTVTGSNSVVLGANTNWQGISLTSPGGAVTIGAGNVLTLGRSGIDLSAATQDLTVSSGLTLLAGTSQTWNIASGRTLTLNTGAFTRGSAAILNVPGAGTVTTTMTGLNAASLVNNLIGPWASFGTGTAASYATINGSNQIAALTYATSPAAGQGISVSTAAGVTDTTGTLNYSVAAVGALGATNASFNTLRYTGVQGTITGNFTANGLLGAVSGSGLVTFSGNVTIGSTQELIVNTANGSVSLTTGIVADNGAGASSLIKTGSGALTVAGLNTYSGGTTILDGSLLLGNNSTFANNVTTSGPLGTGNVTFGGGTTISTNGTSQRAIGAPRFTFNGDVTIGQTTGGTARVSLAGVFDLGGGTRTFTLTNPQTSTTNGTETFQIGAGSTSPAVTIQNGTLAFVAGANVGSGSPASVCFRASTPFTANAGLIIGNQVRVFGAAANYLGTSANAAAVTVNSGGVLDLSSGTTGTSQQSIQVFSLSGSGSIYNGDTDGGGTATLTVNGSASTTFAGVIQDGTVSATSLVALTKTGTGTQALSGQNSYTGPTNVTGGTLQVSASGSINQSASIVVTSGGTLLLTSTSGGLNQVGNSATVALGGTGGGTLQLSGSGISETMGALTLSSNSVIDFGTFSNSNTLTFSNLANFTALTVKGWTGLSYNPLLTTDNGAATQDRLLFTIDPALTATQLSQINFFDDNGVAVGFGAKEVNFSGFTEIVPVPEPSSASLLCSLGMVGLIFYRERRRWSRISRR